MRIRFLKHHHRNDEVKSFNYYGVEYIHSNGEWGREETLWNLAHRLTSAELMPYIKSVDYSSDYCRVQVTDACYDEDEDEYDGGRHYRYKDKREVIDAFLREGGIKYISLVSGERQEGYSEATRNLIMAIRKQSLEEALEAIKQGADPNAILIITPINSDYPSVLHMAVLYKNEELVSALLKAGADPNGTQCLTSPLEIAYRGGSESEGIIKLLLDNGARDIPVLRSSWQQRKRQYTSKPSTKQKKSGVKKTQGATSKLNSTPVVK